jgi:alpha-tubulin suppressor-like RCC1 family protein
VAITEDGKVYEWGFLGSEKQQFHILHDFAADENFVNDEIIDIKCGLEFTLFLSKNGNAYVIGAITQIGQFVFESEEIVHLNEMFGKSDFLDFVPNFAKDFMKEQNNDDDQKDVKISKLDAGYSHAIFLDSEGIVYVFGAGHYGQLGLGFDDIKAKKPVILKELNDGLEKIVNIACGAYSCIAYSDLGLLYSWGMLNGADPDTITYFPTLIGVPANTTLSHINAQSREIIACDVHGELYH